MKKLLGLLGTILVTGNAIPSVIAAAPNRKHSIKKRQTTLTNEENQQTKTGTSNDSQDGDNAPEFIEKEITLNEDYSNNIQKMLQELIDENYIDPLRSINMGGLISKEFDNKAIISKLEELEPRMANWIKKQQNNKNKILILTLKNSDNKSIKLVINLNNFYLLGFINNHNQYFYFNDELLEKIKQNNKNEITELEKIKTDLEKLNKLIKEKNKDKTEKENLEWEIKEKLNKLKELDKLKEQVKLEKNPEEIKKIENNIKNINKLIKEEINKAKDLNKLNKELIEARKTKIKQQIDEKNKKIEKLKEEIFIPIPAINYNNDKKYLDNKIKNLQGEGLKTEEIKTKTLNTKVAEKYNCQKINLNYTGAYSEDGLDVVIKEKDKPTKGKDIILSKDTLNNAIVNLSKYDNKQNENIKNDLVRLIFVTSEAMRFQCDEKTLEIFANIENIDELEKVITDSKNILKDIQEKVFNKNKTINWKDYTPQLRGDWKKYSEQLNKFRIEIWDELIKSKFFNDFIYENKKQINEILEKTENEEERIILLEKLFKKEENKKYKEIKYVFLFFITNWKNLIKNATEKKWNINIENFYDSFKLHKLNIDKNNNVSFLLYCCLQKNLDILKLLIKIDPQQKKVINNYWSNISLLGWSIMLFDLDIIKFLIYNGVEFNPTNNKTDNFTPLCLAITIGRTDAVQLLLDYGDNINFKNKEGDTPLHYAAMFNNDEIIQILLKYRESEIDINIKGKDEVTPLYLAVKNNNVKALKILLKNKANINIPDKNGLLPIHVAAAKNNIEIVKILLANDANIDVSDNEGNIPLHIAAQEGNPEIVELLLNKSKKLYNDKKFKNFINTKNNNGNTPLSNAVINDRVENVKKLLVNGADINVKNNQGNNTICLAANKGNINVVQLLIVKARELYKNNNKKFKEFINQPNNELSTALHLALWNNNFTVIKELLNCPEIDINKINEDNLSPLYGAVANGYTEIVKLLLNYRADINILTKNGDTVLHFAAQNGNQKVMELLLNKARELYNDEKFKKFINMKNKKGNTPLDWASDNGRLAIIKLLLFNGANVNTKDKNNKISLDLAVKKGHSEVVNLLKKFNELNKKIMICNNLLQNIQDEKQKTKINNNLKEFKNKLNELLQIQLSDIIKETDLWELPNNSPETILNKLRELNPNLDINQVKVHENSITDTAANIESIDKIYPDDTVKVTFTLTKKTDNSNYTQKQKNDDSENNIGNKKNYPVKNQSIKSVNSSGMQNQNNLYDVLPDNSCLFWSVATAYLLPVRNNDKKFKTRFIQLFGEENLKYLQLIQKLLKQYDLENNRNLNQLWYQNQIANNLITNAFRNRVVDYIEINLDTISNHGGELTFRNLIQENNEIAGNYLERMRDINSWGGTPEIMAMSNILNVNISVNNDSPYQPINQNSSNIMNIFHVNNRTHYNFALSNQTPQTDTNYKKSTGGGLTEEDNNIENNSLFLNFPQLKKDEYHFIDQKTEQNSLKNDKNLEINLIKNNNKINTNTTVVNKPIITNKNMENLQTTTKNAINKYNTLSKEEKQQKLNKINQHYQSLSENDKKVFKDKLTVIGTSAIGTGISVVGTKITVSSSAVSTSVSAGTEAIEMTPLLSEGGLAAAETLSVAEGTAVVATEGAIIGTEAGTAAALAPETLGLSLVIGGLVIAGTAILWWINSDHTIVKHESHNQYNEIEKYYKFLAHDQLKLDININEWNKIKQIYQENTNNYKEFKNKIKSEITNFHKEDHSGWGGSITDDDINILINVLCNHFQEINNHFLSNPNHGWKIVTNTIGSYFIIEEE